MLFIVSIFCFSIVSADNFDITQINYSSLESIDVIFAGDGFTAAEQNFFITKAIEAEGYLLSSLPLNSRDSDFNTYRMELNSNESGISVIGGVTVDNFLGSYRNRDNMMHYTGFSDSKRDILHENLRHIFKKKVYVFLILNDPDYGGSGQFLDEELISITQSTYDTQYGLFRELILHEFGHSFGDLADEYGGSCDDASRPDDYDPVTYNRKNVTLDSVNDRKWDFLVSPQYILGANYCDTNWYRSSTTGLMRALTPGIEHNELGVYLMNERIDEDIDYNQNLTSFIDDSVSSDSFSSTENIHIHANSVVFSSDINCNELYIAKGASLYMKPNKEIYCTSIVNLGSLVYQKKKKKKSRKISKDKIEGIFSNDDILIEGSVVIDGGVEEVEEKKCEINYFRLIMYGVVGSDVRQIQVYMNSLGFNTGIVDGIYGPKTYAGIIEYQEEKNLNLIDGIIGMETFSSLCL